MNESLHTIGYFSKSTLKGSAEEHRKQIQDILLAARRNNKDRGVTGALLFSDGCFAQVLEGPQTSVEAIMEEILCDPRHTDITILYTQETDKRSFPSWSMAYAGDGGWLRAGLSGSPILASPEEIETNEGGERFLDVLRQHLGRN